MCATSSLHQHLRYIYMCFTFRIRLSLNVGKELNVASVLDWLIRSDFTSSTTAAQTAKLKYSSIISNRIAWIRILDLFHHFFPLLRGRQGRWWLNVRSNKFDWRTNRKPSKPSQSRVLDLPHRVSSINLTLQRNRDLCENCCGIFITTPRTLAFG